MAIEEQYNYQVFTGTGDVSVYQVDFPVFELSHLRALGRTADGTAFTFEQGVDYQALIRRNNAGESVGATITLYKPLTKDYRLMIARIVPIRQDAVFINQGGMQPKAVEHQLDYIVMILQQLQYLINGWGLDDDNKNKHAATHAADGSDPVTPESIHALRKPPDTGKNYLANSEGWVEYVDSIAGGSGASAVVQTHYFSGDGEKLEYVIRHPFDTLNVSVAAYIADTGERIVIRERVVDANTIVLSTITPIMNGVRIRAIVTAPGLKGEEGQIRFEYTHRQPVASDAWTIEHHFGIKYPHVFILDTEGVQHIGDCDWANATENVLTVRFVEPVAGVAIVSP